MRLQAPLSPFPSLCRRKQQFLSLSRFFTPTYEYGRPVLRENRGVSNTLQHRKDVETYDWKKGQKTFTREWGFRKLAPSTWAVQNLWAWLMGPSLPSYSCTVGISSAVQLSYCSRRGFHSCATLWFASGRQGEEGDNVEVNRDDSRAEERKVQDGKGKESHMEDFKGEMQEGSQKMESSEVQSQSEETRGRVSLADSSAPIDTSRTGGYSLEELLDNIAKAQKEDIWIRPQKQAKTRRTEAMTIDELIVFLREENAQDICVIKVPPEREYVDYFVVCGGMGTRHIRMMADNLVAEVKGCGDGRGGRVRVEGKDSDDWMVVDLGSMVVHMMLDEVRERFELEKLWALGPEYDDQLREMQKWLRTLEDVEMN